jgi:hypothetical protein
VSDFVETDILQNYRESVRSLDGAMAAHRSGGLGEDTGTGVLVAVDQYLEVSGALFEVVALGPPAVAALGGDLRLLAELATTDKVAGGGLPVESAERADFLTDMDAIAAIASGREAEEGFVVAASEDPEASAMASVDAIVATGLDTLSSVAAASVLPNVTELPTIVGGIFGPAAGEAFGAALAAVQSTVGTIMRAAAKVLQGIVDKLVSLIGKPAVDQLTEWVEKLVGVSAVYEACLGVPKLRAAVSSVLVTAPDAKERAARTAMAEESHARWQRYLRWGAGGLGWAAPKLNAVQPWGPVVVATVAVVLVVGSGWLTADHLDSFDLFWLPDRFDGVGAALA